MCFSRPKKPFELYISFKPVEEAHLSTNRRNVGKRGYFKRWSGQKIEDDN